MPGTSNGADAAQEPTPEVKHCDPWLILMGWADEQVELDITHGTERDLLHCVR